MSIKDDIDHRRLMDWVRPDPAHGDVAGMLATTFELDPTFFDSDYLPTFLGLGAWEDTSWTNRIAMQRALARTEATVVMMDARRFHGRPRSLHIEVMPKIGHAGMKLHAKILLVVQERAVRLLVGSANLTHPGYRQNREVALPIIATAQSPEISALVEQALTAMPQPLRSWWTPAAERVRSLALQTMANWRKVPSASDRFVWSWGEQTLADQFAALWPRENISTITIVSPFWSDQGTGGPVAQLLGQLGRDRIAGAKLHLLTEAAADTQSTYRPKLPPALAAWDTRQLGIQGQIQAVDPHVLPDEVGGRTDYQSVRPLHAKIVVVEGPNTTLAYVGSANFTLRGWGFAGVRANVEAGVIMLRQGKNRRSLVALIPKTTGKPVPLDGKGRSAVTLLENSDNDAQWPSFIHDIRLVPTGIDNKQLQLVVKPALVNASTLFSVSLVDNKAALLDASRLGSGALEPSVLEQLLRDQRVNVHWNAQSVEFPVNVDLDARLLLPISPGSPSPGESLLLAYYQGKITAEDIYPPPPGEPDDPKNPLNSRTADEPSVDTTRIQSYQIRDFVEALQGIHDDLKLSSKGTEIAMKFALLGEISPVALARQVMLAVKDQRRSPTAAGFQLVEILACLAKAQRFEVPPIRQDAWSACIASARAAISTLLSDLIEYNGGELKSQRAFQRYRTAILPSQPQT